MERRMFNDYGSHRFVPGYTRRIGMVACLCLLGLVGMGCSPTASESSGGNGTNPVRAAGGSSAGKPPVDPHAMDARPSSAEIQERIQKVQADPNLSKEAKDLLTRQMQSAVRDPRTPNVR
ncbi:MAG: hypothetical protein H8F28_00240 [Fibrella sp.]|nr:hypothetical protein [Armatimonadota bacterium]